jgi:D-glycero-alpha-D-manno-heptose-7-phosphate kinase
VSWEKKFEAISDLVYGNWDLKKSVKNRSNSLIDNLIEFGLKNGATASKLCGAGGSGYVLFLGYPDGILNLKEKLQNREILEFEFNSKGVEAIEI